MSETDKEKKEKLLQKVLIKNKLVSEEQLKEVLKISKEKNEFFAQILVEKNIIDEKTLGEILEFNLGVPFINLNDYKIDGELSKYLSEKIIRENKVLPIKKENNMLYVAMANPLDILLTDKMRLITGFEIVPLLAIEKDLISLFEHYFTTKNVVEDIIEEIEIEKEDEIAEGAPSAIELKTLADETPIIKLVNSIITGAITDRASDIHLEPASNGIKVRFRIDGILYDKTTIPLSIRDAVISRIKIISDIDIAERRKPQDGHMSIKVKEKHFDIRVATFLTVYGEQLTLRLLDKSRTLLGLSDLGMNTEQEKSLRALLKSPYGMLLSSAPTGAGKTTTLYSALDTIKSSTKKIITLEDPIEYQIPGIAQAQLNVKAGITFENGLRSILRHDPDIILVGEIRDRETAEVAIQASLTGRYLFSTIHAKDSPSALIRLLNLGIEPFLITSSVIGVISQRLVRKICEYCKVSYKPDKEEIEWLSFRSGLSPKATVPEVDKLQIYKGKGCNHCNNTGYYERIGIFEIMNITSRLKELIVARESSDVILEEAIRDGMQTLYESAVEKVKNGISTVEEAIRVVSSDRSINPEE